MAETKKSHAEWLAEKEREARAKQDAFLGGIAAKLGRARVTAPPAHPFRGAPEFWRTFEYEREQAVEVFTENFSAAGGHVARVPDAEAAAAFIAERAAELGAQRLIRQDQPELAALELERRLPAGAEVAVWNRDPGADGKALAAQADIGVVQADYAVAYTGSLTVLSAANKGRSVSLLPTVLIALLPAERIKTRLGQVLAEFDRTGRENLPAGIHFISGPSRSSDIENDLTIGVHGPGIVYTLIIG